MRAGLRATRRFVSVGLKPEVIKLAVQSPTTGHPKLFVVRRDSTVADFESILRSEFPSVSAFEFCVHDENGAKAALPQGVRQKTSFFDEMKDKELALVADGVEVGMRYDTSSSELKKRFILDLAEKTVRENLVANHNALLKTEFADYLTGQFKADLKVAIDAARPDIEKRRSSIDAIIVGWEAFMSQFINVSVKKSMKPVKLLLLLSMLQFAVLYYLTFYVYDWNVVEPLAYMLSLSIQLGFLLVYALKRKLVGPEFFYSGSLKGMMAQLNRNVFYAEELYIKRRALDNLKILFK